MSAVSITSSYDQKESIKTFQCPYCQKQVNVWEHITACDQKKKTHTTTPGFKYSSKRFSNSTNLEYPGILEAKIVAKSFTEQGVLFSHGSFFGVIWYENGTCFSRVLNKW